jgi:hypothetical protein
MTIKEKLLQEIEQAPDVLLEALLDFLHVVKVRMDSTATEANQASEHDIQEYLLELVGDVTVIKSQGIQNLDLIVDDMREERIIELGGL